MKSHFLPIAIALAVPVISSRAQSDQDIGTLLPDNTSALAVVQNLSKFYELDEDHAFNKIVRHPAITHLYGESFSWIDELLSEETLKEIGLTKEELARLFPARFAMAGNLNFSMLMDASIPPLGGTPGGAANVGLNMKGISFLAAADTTLTEAELTELVAALGKRMVDSSEDMHDSRSFQDTFEGYPMTRMEIKNVAEDGTESWVNTGFILADSMLIVAPMSDNKADMADHIASDMARRIRAQGAEPDSLAGSRSYIDARDQLEEADLFVFAPLDDIASAMETSVSEFYDKATADAAAGQGGLPIGMFVQKDALIDFLGLKNFKRFTMAAKVQDDGIEIVQELATNERTGMLAKMLNYEQGIVLPEMDPAGLKGITISGYDTAESIEELLAEIPKLSPMLGGMLQMQMGTLEGQGMNVRTKMLPLLDSGVTSFYGYATPNPAKDQVPSHAIILNTNDPIGMKTTMSELMGFLQSSPMGGGEIGEPRDFMGESIVDADSLTRILGPMVSVGQDSSGAYAIVGDKLILTVGEKEWMNHVIASLKKGTSSLEDHETVRESWRKWGDENMVEFGYEDLATLIKMGVYGTEEGIQVRAQSGASSDKEADVADAIEGMPSLDDLHFSVTQKSYDTPDAWISRVYIAEKPADATQ